MDLQVQSSKVLPQSSPKTWSGCHRNTPLCWYQFVLVRVSIPAQTSWPRSKLGRKGFIWLTLPYCCSSPRKSGLELKQVRRQELMQRPWRDVHYWLASPGLLSLLSYRTKTTIPEMVPPTRGLSPYKHTLLINSRALIREIFVLASLSKVASCHID